MARKEKREKETDRGMDRLGDLTTRPSGSGTLPHGLDPTRTIQKKKKRKKERKGRQMAATTGKKRMLQK
jgi:hypothetical protein